MLSLALKRPLALSLPLALLSPLVAGATVPVSAPPADAPLVGGRPNGRALVVALHGGSWTGRTPPQLAERLRTELDGEARRAGLRLIVPVAPDGGEGDD